MLSNFTRLVIYPNGVQPFTGKPLLDFDGNFNAKIKETNVKRDLPSFLDGYPRQIAYTNEWQTWELSFPVLTTTQKNNLESLIRDYSNNIYWGLIKRVGTYTGENNIFPIPTEGNQLWFRGGTISKQPARDNPGGLLSGYMYSVELNGYVTGYQKKLQWGGLTILSQRIRDAEINYISPISYTDTAIGAGTQVMVSATLTNITNMSLTTNNPSGVSVSVNQISSPVVERLVQSYVTNNSVTSNITITLQPGLSTLTFSADCIISSITGG